jgi:TRAP-type C4-dicarboxylate transport system substrate-binding protein
VTKYLSLTHHVWNNEILTMSKKAWDTLSPEQQKLVRAASSEIGVYRMQLQRELEVSRLEDLKKMGMQAITPTSIEPFQKLAGEIKKKYASKYAKYDWTKWHDRVLAIK